MGSLFNSADEGKKGYLSIADMRQVLCSSGLPDLDGDNFETVVHEHMKCADKNADGKVCFEEFVGYRNNIIEYCYNQVKKEIRAENENTEASPQFSFVD